jgi:membrane protein implicated in regulation of membrane protease activity
MGTVHRMQFVWMQTAWMLATVVFLVTLEALTLELYVLLTSVGLLVVAEFTAGLSTAPDWRRRLRWLLVALVLVAAAIIVRRVLEILPPGVV